VRGERVYAQYLLNYCLINTLFLYKVCTFWSNEIGLHGSRTIRNRRSKSVKQYHRLRENRISGPVTLITRILKNNIYFFLSNVLFDIKFIQNNILLGIYK